MLNINAKHTGHDISFNRNFIILDLYPDRLKNKNCVNVNPLGLSV